MANKVLVTGASGLLGRAILKEFETDTNFQSIGAAFSRAKGQLISIDLNDATAIAEAVAAVAPTVIVHAAAERRPDSCGVSSTKLNVDASFHLARCGETAGTKLFIQISTDYLWDGTAAPYKEDAPTCPLNEYGAQKARAEHAALAGHPNALVLRVPVLYGPTHDLSESAATILAETVRNSSKAQSADDWQIRVPTLTSDIAATIHNIVNAALGLPAPSGPKGRSLTPGVDASALRGILHYTAGERFTRWTLVQLFGRLMGLSTAHVSRLEGKPPGAPRPYDCHLDDSKLRATGLAAPNEPFEQAAKAILGDLGLLAAEAGAETEASISGAAEVAAGGQ